MGDPAPMHTHYCDTVAFDWASHFARQPDSGLGVKEYCARNRVKRSTWYHIKQQYDQCENKSNFTHVKQRPGVDPLLSSSGEKAVDSQLARTVSGTLNSGIIAETVKRRLLDKYDIPLETLSRAYTVKLSKQLDYFYGSTQYRTYNKIRVTDSVLTTYQQQYNNLVANGISLEYIYNVDATKCHGNLLPKKTYKKRRRKAITQQPPVEQPNSGVHDTHINTDHYFTLLNTVSATGNVLLPFFIVANRYINKFKPPIYKLCSSAGEVPIYQHAQYRYYITFSKSGSLSGDIMLKYINKVVANSDHTIYLLLDYAPVHRTMEFKLHCTVKNVQLHYIPANTTHLLQVNDLVVFAQLKEHLAYMHNRLIAEQQTTANLIHDIEYTAVYLLHKFKRAIIPYCFHYVAHATIPELRIKNNVFKSYVMYRSIDAFDARNSAPTQ